jgi:RNA polymerase sigma factor (sigma-70 family)
MGKEDEAALDNGTHISQQERDLEDILLSSDPISELRSKISKIPYILKKETAINLKRRLREPHERQKTLTELTWLCLPQLNHIVTAHQNLGIDGKELIDLGLLHIQENILEWEKDEENHTPRTLVYQRGVYQMKTYISEYYGVNKVDMHYIPAYLRARNEYAEAIGENYDEEDISKLTDFLIDEYPELSSPPHTNVPASLRTFRTKRHHSQITLQQIHSVFSQHILKVDFPQEYEIDREIDQHLLQITVNTALNSLSEREVETLSRRFGLGKHEPISLADTGKLLGVSRERIRQLEDRALEKLRHPYAAVNLHAFSDDAGLVKLKTKDLPKKRKQGINKRKTRETEPPIYKDQKKPEPAARNQPKPPTSEIPIPAVSKELPVNYWNSNSFWINTRRFSTKGEKLAQEEYPETIELGRSLNKTVEFLRLHALRGNRYWALLGYDDKRLPQLKITPLAPNLENLSVEKFYYERELRELPYFTGDIMARFPFNTVNLLGREFRIPKINTEPFGHPAISIRHLYRFLKDKKQPLLTGMVTNDNVCIAFRTATTKPIDLKAYKDRNMFERDLYQKHAHVYLGEVFPRSDIRSFPHTLDSNESDIAKHIAKEYNLVLYTGAINEPIKKVRL